MATIYVTEYQYLGADERGNTIQAGKEPALADTPFSFTSTAQASNAFTGRTRFVRIISDADCHIKFGEDPTATTNNQKLIAGVSEHREVIPGHKLSARTA